MKKQLFCTFISFVLSHTIQAQSIQLENLRVSDKKSKTVYIGIDNHFAIKGNGTVLDIIPTDGVSLNKDQLLIRVNMLGSLPITFITAAGKEVITFEKKVIPDPEVSIGNDTNLEASKSTLLQQKSVRITTRINNENFWEGYEVVSFQAAINGATFQEQGQAFSAALINAIQQAKTGDTISISNVKAYNKDLQRDLNLEGPRIFKIN